MILSFLLVSVMESFWQDMNNEFKLTTIKKASLFNKAIEISSFPSGRVNVLVGNLTLFEIDESVIQCRLNRWYSRSNLTELHINHVEENLLLIQQKNLNQRGKYGGALGDKLSFKSISSDCCQLDVDLVIMKKSGFVTFSNNMYPVNSGDIKFSMQLTKQKASRFHNNNDTTKFDTRHIHLMLSTKNGLVSIIDQNQFFSVEVKNIYDPFVTLNENGGRAETLSKNSEIQSVTSPRKLQFTLKNESTWMVWCSYVSHLKWRTIQIFDWYHMFQVIWDRNAFPICSSSCNEKMKNVLQILTSYTTTIRPQRWQLFTVLQSVQIRNVLKRSPIETLYKLSTEQSICTIDDFCEALTTRRFDVILKKDYLHQWRRIATPGTIKKILKPLCKCRKKRLHSPEMQCSFSLVN